jgi:hypothetical protein
MYFTLAVSAATRQACAALLSGDWLNAREPVSRART